MHPASKQGKVYKLASKNKGGSHMKLKRLVATLLFCVVVIGLLPMSAMAAPDGSISGQVWDYSKTVAGSDFDITYTTSGAFDVRTFSSAGAGTLHPDGKKQVNMRFDGATIQAVFAEKANDHDVEYFIDSEDEALAAVLEFLESNMNVITPVGQGAWWEKYVIKGTDFKSATLQVQVARGYRSNNPSDTEASDTHVQLTPDKLYTAVLESSKYANTVGAVMSGNVSTTGSLTSISLSDEDMQMFLTLSSMGCVFINGTLYDGSMDANCTSSTFADAFYKHVAPFHYRAQSEAKLTAATEKSKELFTQNASDMYNQIRYVTMSGDVTADTYAGGTVDVGGTVGTVTLDPYLVGTTAPAAVSQPYPILQWVAFRWKNTTSALAVQAASRNDLPPNGNLVGVSSAACNDAFTRLSAMVDEDPASLNTTDLSKKIEIWGLRAQVCIGVSIGILPESCLDSLVGIRVPETAGVMGPKLFGEQTQVRSKGYIYLWYLYQELPDIVVAVTPAISALYDRQKNGENINFSTVRTEIEVVHQMYELFSSLNDESLWEMWDNGAYANGTKLSELYSFLAFNDAFKILEKTTEVQEGNAFSYFFQYRTDKDGKNPDVTSGELSSELLKGIKVSAQFLPMKTNVYDPHTWVDIVDTGWLLNYYAKFGYNRKVLYIDTATDAASNYVNTKGRGNLRVATLEDLLQSGDVVLYLDDNLYNVKTISELVDKAWDRLDNVDNASTSLNWWGSLWKTISNLWTVSMEEIAKTAEKTSYSTRVNSNSKKWGEFFLPFQASEEDKKHKETNADGTEVEVVEQVDDIQRYLYPDQVWDTEANELRAVDPDTGNGANVEYSPMMGFATLSGVYRDNDLLKNLNKTLNANTPVFIASDTAPFIAEDYATSIYNYMLMRNLESQMTVDYASSLDRTSPLYMDVFGNILTESGLVVIPAAANATLYNKQYLPYNAALASTYGAEYFLPYDDMESAKYVNDMLARTYFAAEDGKWVLRSAKVKDGTVDVARLSVADRETLVSLAEVFEYDLTTSNYYDLSKWEMIITEVLRGAPIENIDKQFEGIQVDTRVTRQGLLMAERLEFLVDALHGTGQNANIAIPNPAYIDGLEIIVFFVYKVLILFVLIAWMVNIYLDATGMGISLRTAGKCIGVVVLVITLIVGVPRIFELTYYEANKYLLQDETEYLMMLNLEKEANGQEIGVSKVREPDNNTHLYLHLADVNMPWWDILTNIATSASYKSLDAMYSDYENRHPLAYSSQTTTFNGSVYIDVQDLFESSTVSFSPITKQLFVASSSKDTPASYYTPYYYFLDTICTEITRWSKDNNFIAYTTKQQRGGALKTVGYCRAFFQSEEFLEDGSDYFNLYQVYEVPAPREYKYLSVLEHAQSGEPATTLDLLQNSQWCNIDNSVASTTKRIEKLNQYAQEWIANNYSLIGKVSDETFLKCFALSCAMEHNRLFNTQRADNLEIQEISNEDLLRLSIAPKQKVMQTSTMSYARMVYLTGGTVAIYAAAVLELVNFVSAWVKPACTLLVFLIACCSIFVLKLVLRKGNNSVFGYVITIALMCSVNILGALMTKLSMYVPQLGLSPTVCILLQCVVQVAYIFIQVKIVLIALRDWRNVGYQRYQSAIIQAPFGHREQRLSVDYRPAKEDSGWPEYERLKRINERRQRHR